MKFHPYSEVFPLIEGAEFDALVDDIKAHGLREKIWCFKGAILDGRNRFLACKKAGVKAITRPFKGSEASALAFVISANLQRRHLTVEQRAFVGARIATLQRGDNQHTARAATSQKEVAEQLGISPDSIQRAKKIIEQGSKALKEAAESGEVPLKKAAKLVELPKSEQLKAAAEKPAKPLESPEPDMMPEPEPLSADEIAEMDEAAERARQEFAEKVMDSDDRIALAGAEVGRLTRDLASMKLHRDHWLNQAGANARFAKGWRRKAEKIAEKLEEAQIELEKLRERVAIMEAA